MIKRRAVSTTEDDDQRTVGQEAVHSIAKGQEISTGGILRQRERWRFEIAHGRQESGGHIWNIVRRHVDLHILRSAPAG